MVPDGASLSLGVDSSDLLIEVRVSLHVLPERLSVLGIVATSVVLLCAVVGEGDSAGSECENLSLSQTSGVVAVSVQETSVVVIVDEHTKGVDVGEVLSLSIIATTDAIHGFVSSENVGNGVVHWVVEEGSEGSLVGSNVGGISIEALSHLENARGLAILIPEVLADFWDRVDANTIEAVLVDDSLNPVLEVLSDIAVVLVKIGKAGETAVLNGALVIPVNIAVVVVVLSLV